jgi:hypothetical protein
MSRDYLDEIIAKRSARNPRFPQMVKDAVARQDWARSDPSGADVNGGSEAPKARPRVSAEHRSQKEKV